MATASLRRHRKRKLKAEINVVPYIDVMLVLLIIFMVTAPLLNVGVDVNLPQSDAKPLEQKNTKPVVVQVASDGRVALEQMLARPPALLLLDLNLQGMDGEEVLRQLREQPALQHLPVVILSAVADVQRIAGLDCQGLLGKPVDLDELRALVKAILQEYSDDAQ